MKKTIFCIVILAQLLAACSNDDNFLPASEDAATGISFSAVVNGNSVTRALSDNDNGKIDATWGVGDEIALIYQVSGENKMATATVKSVDDDGKATIKATLEDNADDGSDFTLIYPATAADGTTGNVKSDLLAEQDGTLESISSNLDVRTTSGTLVVNGRKATIASSPTLTPSYLICKFTLKDRFGSEAVSKSNVQFGDVIYPDGNFYTAQPKTLTANKLTIKSVEGGTNVAITVTLSSPTDEVYVAMPNTSTSDLIKFEATDGTYTYRTYSTAELEAGKFYTSTLKLSAAIALVGYVGEAGTVETGTNYTGLAIALNAGLSRRFGSEEFFNYQGCCTTSATFTDHYNILEGIARTAQQANKTGACASHDHPAATAARDYSVAGFTPSEHSMSNWFLPSFGQWLRFLHDGFGLDYSDGWYYLDRSSSRFSSEDLVRLSKLFLDAGDYSYYSSILGLLSCTTAADSGNKNIVIYAADARTINGSFESATVLPFLAF